MAISLQRLTIHLHSAHRAVIFAIAQLSCTVIMVGSLAGYNDREDHHVLGMFLYLLIYLRYTFFRLPANDIRETLPHRVPESCVLSWFFNAHVE